MAAVAYTVHERQVWFMQVDTRMLRQMLSLPDESLWEMLRLLSGGKMNLPEPDGVGMRKVRAVLSSITDADIGRVMELLSIYSETK